MKDALEIGKAAEHLVCADLMLQGYRAFLSDQGLPYDLLVDLGDRFIRVQVKSTSGLRTTVSSKRNARRRYGYVFNPRRRGKDGQKRLTVTECDVVAFVALDVRKVAYLPISEVPSCVVFYPADEPEMYGGKAPLTLDKKTFAGCAK